MNYLKEFENSLSIEEYLGRLGDQLELHNLHYRRARVPQIDEKWPPVKILIITEPWCGDSAAIVPVIQKLFSNRPAEMRIALRDAHAELMDQFLTRGGRAIPIILVLDDQGELLMRFGPRPKKIQAIYEQHRSDIEAGKIAKSEVIKKIRTFYSRDKGVTILEEFLEEFKKHIE